VSIVILAAQISPAASSEQASAAPPAASPIVAQPTMPVSQREAQLRSDLEQLNEASAKLKQAVDNAGSENLSLDVVRLSQQVHDLAQRIEIEVKQP
jgi:site-specific recombinase